MKRFEEKRCRGWGLRRSLGGAVLWAFLASLVTLATSPARAQDAEAPSPEERVNRAREAYAQGEEAFYAGRFQEALDRFSLAYELSSRGELLYNIGTAHDRLGNRGAAARAYQDYLRAVPEAPNRSYVEARLEVLQREEDEVAERIEPEDTEASGSAGEANDEGSTELVEPEADIADVSERSDGPNVAGIALLATAGAVGIAAVVTGVMALGQRSDLDDGCTDGVCGPEYADELDRLDRLTISTDVLIGVAAVAATVGVVLFLVGGDDDDATVGCGLAHCQARVRW